MQFNGKPSMSFPTDPGHLYRMLSDVEREALQIPMPAWMEKDALRKSFDLYPRLWVDGKVVFGCLIQANSALFADGSFNAPGEVVYDPSDQVDVAYLGATANKIAQLKNTQPADPALRAIADYLTNEKIRVCGVRVPTNISARPVLISSIYFCREHLPNRVLSRASFPLLINERYPGVAMVLPYRWWPDEFIDEWLGNPAGTKARKDLAATASRQIDIVGGKQRCCGSCKKPMRKLGLASHYKHQKPVEIDVCETCSLIWFDDTESARLAGPGLADLVRVVHHAMRRERPLEPLPITLPCMQCGEPLKRVPNISRFGRTEQLECLAEHGTYQTFAQFLAAKGYYRKFTWADIKQVLASGKRLMCYNCGAALEPHPHDECPYCRSSVGLLDPARLASAIDVEGASSGLKLAPTLGQSSCPCCGGALDLTGEMACPHCKAIVRPVEMERALNASESVEAQVRRNHEAQLEEVSRRKLAAMAMTEKMPRSLPDSEGGRRLAIIAAAVVTIALVALVPAAQKAHQAQVDENLDLQNDGMRGLSPTVKQGIVNARAIEAMKKIPHAPAGVVPPQFELLRAGDHVTLVSHSDQRLRVKVNLYDEYLSTRCKMTNPDDPKAGASVIFEHNGESHDFVAQGCKASGVARAQNEFIVDDLDGKQTVFKSDSAFYIY